MKYRWGRTPREIVLYPESFPSGGSIVPGRIRIMRDHGRPGFYYEMYCWDADKDDWMIYHTPRAAAEAMLAALGIDVVDVENHDKIDTMGEDTKQEVL